jgi:hypothetical protein
MLIVRYSVCKWFVNSKSTERIIGQGFVFYISNTNAIVLDSLTAGTGDRSNKPKISNNLTVRLLDIFIQGIKG